MNIMTKVFLSNVCRKHKPDCHEVPLRTVVIPQLLVSRESDLTGLDHMDLDPNRTTLAPAQTT